MPNDRRSLFLWDLNDNGRILIVMSRSIFVLLGVLAVSSAQDGTATAERVLLGSGEHRYEWEQAWPASPNDQLLGATHGGIVFGDDGHTLVATESKRGILVFDADGQLIRNFGEAFARGNHGMHLVEQDGQEFLVLAHIRLRRVIAITLEGEPLWNLEAPDAGDMYDEERVFRPTSVAYAPDGRLYVADGYGQSFVHIYDRERNYLRSIGGFGTAPGQFNVPHGLIIDTRGDEPRLLVADRGNGRIQSFTLDGELLGQLDVKLRRPCSIAERDGDLVIADLDGRVTILDEQDQLVTHLGDNEDVAQRGKFIIERKTWKNGAFLSPHHAAWNDAGDLFVLDWNKFGRVTKLKRLK
ncbi:MAG: hypothetical protein ACI8TQ_001908 [Planctomycetota bacterium]